ncbi:MAG: undecaprenyl/decaprenyl-phosphate alpha-N-acetylglucosaminyl 1-phosphate transferase, partial [Candidatus Omnitrophica bacterium]|nr:undecaprenyl/decaprenyl-phosphate alpha-N-acetylglucosaminyl 1-phosphate transferase [Candidatus Omnitrophota bacterium]
MKSFKKPIFLAGLGIVILLSLKGWFSGKAIYWSYLFSLSFLFAFLLTPAARWLALRAKLLDYPEKRKIHKIPVPLLGGLALYLSFAFVIIYNFHFSLELKGVALGASLIFALGLVDDIKELPAALKLGVQIFACLILIHYGVVLSFPYPDLWWGRILASFLTILWVVGITNSINFLDGLDGLVTGLGIISSLFFLIIALETGQTYLAYLSIVLAGALLGFLWYNFHPAKIFLGDSGSTF